VNGKGNHPLRLFLLFIVLPAVELALLIEIGQHFGTLTTLGLIVVTGALGAGMARHQGLRVLAEVQRELADGRLPAGSMMDVVLILLAAAVLVTPGVLTDAFGFLCLTPGFRSLVKREMLRRFEHAVAEQRVHLHVHGHPPHPGSGPIIDVTPSSDDDPRDR
jgi:UPF0716 protein FxsA